MEGIGHVQIHKHLEFCRFSKLMLHDRYGLLRDRDDLVDEFVVTTETDMGWRGLRCDD